MFIIQVKQINVMKYLSIILMLIVAMPIYAAPQDQQPRLRCVAVLAILAYDQKRGSTEFGAFPPLSMRGARFAQLVEDEVMRTTRQSRKLVRAKILAIVLEFQAAMPSTPNPFVDEAPRCIAMLDKIVPPPTLPHCAAIVGFAYDDVRAREGLSKSAKDLATIAAVLGGRARDELRLAGKTESQGDVVMGLAREAARRDKAEPDLESCFERARR
jgi:hypothetical protein